jgi:hypothetical protein
MDSLSLFMHVGSGFCFYQSEGVVGKFTNRREIRREAKLHF